MEGFLKIFFLDGTEIRGVSLMVRILINIQCVLTLAHGLW